jgi:FixJ family two-component response regulator
MSDKFHTICIIDDDPAVCRALSRVLKLAGFSVTSYGSGRELFDDKQMESIDLILLDIKMPVMDGFAVQENLSAAGFNIPIVFMTAHEVDSMRTKAMEKDVAAFLQKPIDEKDLLEAIHKSLKRVSGRKDIMCNDIHR